MIYVPLFSRLFPGAAAFAAKPFRKKIRDVKGMLGLGAQVFLDQVSWSFNAKFGARDCPSTC